MSNLLTKQQLNFELGDDPNDPIRKHIEAQVKVIERLRESGIALMDYCHENPKKVLDIPDKIWVPFLNALAEATTKERTPEQIVEECWRCPSCHEKLEWVDGSKDVWHHPLAMLCPLAGKIINLDLLGRTNPGTRGQNK